MDPTQAILIVLVAVVMGWFALGVVWNIRRGNAVLKWMQTGLPRLGEKTTLRWLGSSAVELSIAKARPPFRRVDLLLVLEPRDVPWFWLLTRLRGRRDMLIVRGQLTTAPQFEYDLLAPGSWSERETVGRGEARQWETEALGDARFRAPVPTRSLSRQIAPGALGAARKVQPIVWRLSSRRESPQLELHVPLPNPRQADATQFFNALRALAEQMTGR
ncbi:MAG: hypothetical protein A2W37_03220 [Chloroflexi bacterium RBG_16_63_12]|jgi:hypothetical protein|nr:MAG: hypothetical protein A2W37_03220 [Chloroflexi bacterium RBG_16_63_12]